VVLYVRGFFVYWDDSLAGSLTVRARQMAAGKWHVNDLAGI
jgi:hypothetical protein